MRLHIRSGDPSVFNNRIPLKTLAILCRSLSTMLHSGVAVQKAVETAGKKLGDAKCRKTLKEVGISIRKGDDLTTAFKAHGTYFPDLFCDMLSIAEHTGTLPEVLDSLAEHYDNLVELRRNFLAAIAMPVIQFLVAVLIITFVIFILGMIAESRGGEPLDVLGWGFVGQSGAIRFLTYVGIGIASLIFSYLLITRGLRGAKYIHAFLLKIPIVGGCMRSFAIARFSWAFALTQKAGMDIKPSLEASLRATANGVFEAAAPQVVGLVMAGEDLTDSFRATQLFPEDYLQIVHVGETTGTVPEQLDRLSPQFRDQARRSLVAMATAFSWFVWALVAGFIILVIFSIVSWYLSLLNDALKGF